MKTVLIATALLLAAAAPAAAVTPASAADVCLMHRDVDGWGAHGDHAMIVNDRFGRKYLVSLAGLCSDLDFSFGVGIRSLGGVTFGCVERGDRIVMRGGGAMPHNDSCWITKIVRYTPEMQAAYKAELEAKKGGHAN
jgi:hypothetical protein